MTACEQQCRQELGRLLQVQLALGRDQERVRRAFWYVGETPFIEDPSLSLRRLDTAAGRDIVQALGVERRAEGRVYVADPQGSVILSYPADVEQKELLRDLKRLISVSGKGS
jgi:cytochrome oxidase Cu insertion factor (SCO1/SenC/PrrC family)